MLSYWLALLLLFSTVSKRNMLTNPKIKDIVSSNWKDEARLAKAISKLTEVSHANHTVIFEVE